MTLDDKGNDEDSLRFHVPGPQHYPFLLITGVLIEILSSRSNAEIARIKAAYKKDLGRDLEEDLMSETSGDFKRLLVSLANGCRDESSEADADLARDNAQALVDAGVKKWGTDEETFNRILCTLSHEQLRLMFDEYQVRNAGMRALVSFCYLSFSLSLSVRISVCLSV